MLRQLLNGIRRHPWRFVFSIPVAFAALWGMVEAFAQVYPSLSKPYLLIILAAGALIIGFVQAWSPKQVSLYWSDLHLRVEIKTGDLFKQDGNIAITVDDFFLTKAPKLVNPKSLIGQLIDAEYPNNPDLLDTELQQFVPSQANAITESSGIPGKDKRYSIGTTAVIRRSQKNLFVTALCKVDLINN